jgi:hypothetical protein
MDERGLLRGIDRLDVVDKSNDTPNTSTGDHLACLCLPSLQSFVSNIDKCVNDSCREDVSRASGNGELVGGIGWRRAAKSRSREFGESLWAFAASTDTRHDLMICGMKGIRLERSVSYCAVRWS